ncbi:hypothetical protein INT43_002868 [Umbelopsis isabellina]|uniref:Sorting nexin/Vps5-like C-terminal domain-containing protein n=1 Tax=Mortierella isabellina TaxID=91625 RepID=A0A8H7Q6G1_MORIS|nr:hypothetical protein INT43_002868 [Umbelopsis isabellina]
MESNLRSYQHKTGRGERTYSEFERLATHLTLVHEDLFVPALPDMTVSVIAGQRPEDEDKLLLARMQRWINLITSHPVFKYSDLVKEFAESGQGFMPTVKPQSFHRHPSRFQLMKGGLGLSGGAPADVDNEYISLTNQIQAFSQGLQAVSKAVQANFKCRKALSTSYLELGNKMGTFSEKENNAIIQNSYRRMADALQECGELQRPQAQAENALLTDAVAYQTKNAQIAKDALDARLAGISQHHESTKTTESKLKTMNKLKASNSIKSARVNDAIEDMQEAKAQEQEVYRRCEKVNLNLKKELSGRYKTQVTEDITKTLADYVKAQIQYERQMLQKWEGLQHSQGMSVNRTSRWREGSIEGRIDERKAAALLGTAS